MFLRSKIRKKDGKSHRYWSVVENRRVGGGRVVQRHVLYLGEINDTQELAWRRSIEVMEAGAARPRALSLFPEDRGEELVSDASIVRVRLSQVRLCRPRQWGACWLALMLWRELGLDGFWAERLGPSRKGTRWDQVLFVLVAYRLLAPGSEWRLHREWFERSALADLLGEDAGLAESHKLYRCHDRLLEHKQAVFDHLVERWRDDPARLWSLYLQLVSVEEAFKDLKGDLAIRPLSHQLESRIEAHIFIAFLAYCLHVTLGRRLQALAPGLTPRSAIEKFAAVQMIDLHVPTTDGRELLLTRYTEPEPELILPLDKLKLVLPDQPRPKITAHLRHSERLM